MSSLRQDLRYATRSLRRTPAFTTVVILTLALGIGATTGIFSIVRAVLLRPLPFPSPSALVQLHTLIPGEHEPRRSLSPPNFASFRDNSASFAAVSAVLTGDRVVSGTGAARTAQSAGVSASFFTVIGVSPVIGRGFLPRENDPGAEPVVVVSDAMSKRLSATGELLGRQVILDGVAHSVIGVMPPGFDFPEGTELWLPQRYDGAFSSTTELGRKSNTWIPVIARLRAGLDVGRVGDELSSFSRELERSFPGSNTGVGFAAVPLHDALVGDATQPLYVLFAAVTLLLVIACSNIAGLLLARAASRREEMAIRRALGAGRGRLVQQVLTEVTVLGAAGGVFGLLIAWWVTPVLAAASSANVPRLGEVRVDLPVLAFAFGLTLLATLLAGLLPALRATEGRLSGALRAGGRSGTGSTAGQRARGALVIGQLALAVVLLSSGGLLLRSFEKLMSVDPGFRASESVAFRLEAPSGAYPDDDDVTRFFDEVLTRARSVPGMQTTGAVSRLPLASTSLTSRFRLEAAPLAGNPERVIGVRTVTADYFAAIGIPLRRGRVIAAGDRAGTEPVVVINETAARRFFPGEDPVGRRLVDFSYDAIEKVSPTFTIVGVVGDVRHTGLDQPPEPEAYFSQAQVPLRTLNVIVRTRRMPSELIPDLAAAIAAVDAGIPSPVFQTLGDVISASVATQRHVTVLLGLFASLALGLAALGLFGLLSYSVAQRTREFGIRLALGANASQVMSLATSRAAWLIAVGLVLGIVGARLSSRAIQGMLFQVGPADPVTLTGVVAVLFVTGLAAAWIPARRAASVDPVIALREE